MSRPAIDPRQASSPVPIYNADGTYNDDYIRWITRHRRGGTWMPKNVDDEKYTGRWRSSYSAKRVRG